LPPSCHDGARHADASQASVELLRIWGPGCTEQLQTRVPVVGKAIVWAELTDTLPGHFGMLQCGVCATSDCRQPDARELRLIIATQVQPDQVRQLEDRPFQVGLVWIIAKAGRTRRLSACLISARISSRLLLQLTALAPRLIFPSTGDFLPITRNIATLINLSPGTVLTYCPPVHFTPPPPA
jgi:hypothetical protein